ncbi:MAG: queuosine precursor transporter [Eubacteriaceae bacterium]|nr:queuosine precursor transporter [Eubacteriaceae bacterium]
MPTENRNWFFHLGPDETKASPLLMFLSTVFVGILLISNVLANHMLQIFLWTADAGALAFPITYIVSDILSEVYGYKWSRRVAWTSLATNALFALLVRLAVALPQPKWYNGSYFAAALGNSWRIVAASLVAYWAGDLADDRVFRRMKRGSKTIKGFALRALASSFAGHLIDTTLFCILAFAPVIESGSVPWNELPGMVVAGVCIKFAYECSVMPITWRIAKAVKKHEDTHNGNE